MVFNPKSHPTVLVVEDDYITRLDAAETLREAGFEVLEADDAKEALEVIATRDDIAVLFTDINMPGAMNGVELARKARRLYPAMQLLLTSGETRPKASDLPAKGAFLAKPYSAEGVTRAVGGLLAWRRGEPGAFAPLR